MELIKSAAKRSRVSDFVYIFLNLALALAVLGLTMAFSPPYLAYFAILLSKWRVLAVRPRFWLANIQANAVDVFVGISTVTLIWQASSAPLVQVLLAILYAAWLLVLKPSAKRRFITMQAGISQLLALSALLSVAYMFDTGPVTLIAWGVGYICARHVLSTYDDEDTTLLSMMWGFVVAEIVWLAQHWTVAYQMSGSLMIPQAAIIISLIGYVAARSYDLQHHHTLSWKAIRGTMLFSIAVISILLIKELVAIVSSTT